MSDKSSDDLLNVFLNEIELLGKIQNDTTTVNFTPDELCIRLTSQTFSNPYQVLQLKHDATEDEIKQKYRKLSLLVHPDKCKHENAQQAFQILKDAYNEIQKEEIRERYKNVYDVAKAAVYKKHKLKSDATSLDLIASGILDEDLEKIKVEIQNQCEEILKKQQERREYAEKCIKANIEYEKKLAHEQLELEKQKLHDRVEWDKTRDMRVNSWRTFQSKVDSKEFKLAAFKGVEIKKETRHEFEPTKTNSIAESIAIRHHKRKKIIDAQTSKHNLT